MIDYIDLTLDLEEGQEPEEALGWDEARRLRGRRARIREAKAERDRLWDPVDTPIERNVGVAARLGAEEFAREAEGGLDAEAWRYNRLTWRSLEPWERPRGHNPQLEGQTGGRGAGDLEDVAAEWEEGPPVEEAWGEGTEFNGGGMFGSRGLSRLGPELPLEAASRRTAPGGFLRRAGQRRQAAVYAGRRREAGATPAPAEEGRWRETDPGVLDLAFQRDARRYDGEFALY